MTSWFERLNDWRERHLTEQQLVLILALLTGLGYPLGWVLCSISLILCYHFIPWEKKQAARQAA